MAKRTSRTSTSKPKPAAEIDAVRHKDTRKNIPTEELRDFVADEEGRPKMVLYPRDPSLDPQLVWRGKDEQDRQDLAVPAVPIYIQEKIHPQAIIDDFRRAAARQTPAEDQLDLFADFNGLDDFEKRVDFYHHDQHWSNRMILGDSLLVMTSFAEKEGLKGQVQTIYFDPPYGIKFGSNWQVSTRKRDVKDGKVDDVTRQPEQIRAFRDTWERGINSYLSYLRDRLVAAREILTDTGSIFVQIGDENVHLVRSVLDEVFGRENFCSLISVAKTSTTTGRLLPGTTDYIIWYAKDSDRAKYRSIYTEKSVGGIGASKYDQVELRDGLRRPMNAEEKVNPETLPPGSRPFRFDNLTSPRIREARTGYFPITVNGREYLPQQGEWKTSPDGISRLQAAGRVAPTGNSLSYVRYVDDFPAFSITNTWTDISGAIQSRADPKVYVVQTSTAMVQRCLLMTTDPGDLVLDPTCGSGTTAYVAEQWGRRWITIDTSRVALALARTRMMSARFPYYLLADSPEGRRKEAELSGVAPAGGRTDDDIRKGFVYQRVPHVTLKSIANNPDLREGMTRDEIDAAIARHAETETLFDKPYEDAKRIRVSGPFTVESLSPHRTISVEEKRELAEVGRGGQTLRVIGPDKFGLMILENLKKAGVQNTVKNERLKFDSLEPFAGEWLHGEGKFTEADGRQRRAAITIGPEYGTVGPELIKEAAKEAVRGVGFDVLIVCGFAFDPHVAEEARRYGKLTVLTARMNPDLAMGDELLKKTGAGNLFMVFGEPDIVIVPAEEASEKKPRRKPAAKPIAGLRAEGNGDQVIVEIRGLDVYDPTTGAIRSSSTDDIACWFIDTAYNGESFFVRHAYFTGAQEPYEKLKRALRAEIDESAWSQLYSTRSRPFARPDTGKIAVKVINHYGDEVLKVYDVAPAT